MFSLGYLMRRSIECNCDRGITNFRYVKFGINDSMIEPECNICNGLIGWWQSRAEKDNSIKANLVSGRTSSNALSCNEENTRFKCETHFA